MAKRFFEGLNHSKNYALYRPIPPPSLIQAIVKNVSSKDLAVDVGCGSGQSTGVLSSHFKRVVGIDVSQAQIDEASKAFREFKNLQFLQGPSEKLPFEDNSVDLVSTCQAIHWFDFEAFYREVDRVLKPQEGLLAVYGYHLTGPSPSVPNHELLASFRDEIFNDITGPYWTPERRLVDSAYRTIPALPYPKVQRSDDEHHIEVQASLGDFAGYVRTWSGFQGFTRCCGEAKAEDVIQEFLSKSKKALKVSEKTDPKEIQLKLRTNYFLLQARKTT